MDGLSDWMAGMRSGLQNQPTHTVRPTTKCRSGDRQETEKESLQLHHCRLSLIEPTRTTDPKADGAKVKRE